MRRLFFRVKGERIVGVFFGFFFFFYNECIDRARRVHLSAIKHLLNIIYTSIYFTANSPTRRFVRAYERARPRRCFFIFLIFVYYFICDIKNTHT